MSHKIRVSVVRGGPSSEYEVSLNTGANILSALHEKLSHKYHPQDILIDREGKWHKDGLPVSLENICINSDVIVNALHGSFGEDGKLQHILEAHNVPFTGSGSLGSAVSMNKVMTKKSFEDHGIKTPYARVITTEKILDDSGILQEEMYNTLLLPVVVKPVASGSSVGVSLVREYDELTPALLRAASEGNLVMLEEYVPGIEATCGVIEKFRGQDIYALPPVEIRPHSSFFDYDAKYKGMSEEIVPASFADTFKHTIQEMAQKIHQVMGLRHYSRSDFIIHPKKGIYALEVNTLPGFTDQSLMPKSLRAIGSDTHEFVDHVINLALM
jgi:D-alanine-D-alanine ligase